ncbi:rhomboid family intramembrane serine protease [Paraliomyxa miuraensis]|uniref:rhomboid family intramembrane serine protease n=1 Tax=Paraliomyxa miuraensis TaxID=376150 RepID=UPI00224CE7C8|nr:rhomboid family intramembrane serine protease [Paraliomyxa miuraensis]MCX4245061.1 rhomboid family intramembrane serine protease [Paraliomyxa miuraensis]
MSTPLRAQAEVSAQCSSCGLHELVSVVLARSAQGAWQPVENTGNFLDRWRRRTRPGTRPDPVLTTVQIDVCPVCMGAWFDRGELDVLSGDLGDVEQVLAPELGRAQRPCPHGHGLMVEQQLPGLIRTPVDRCQRCGGIWLDGHERRKLAKASTREGQGTKTERWLRRGAIWAAQVLTHLPVEVDNPARGTPWVVLSLLVGLFGLFLLQVQGVIDTYTWALVPGRLQANGDWWTLGTSILLHGTWVHILGNAYFLYTFGDNVEHLFGRWRFLAFYLAAGLVGAVAQALLTTKTALPVVGASGSIAGVLGAYLWAFPRQRLFQVILWIQLQVPMWMYLGVWVAFHVVMGLFGTGQGAESVAWFAHLGGFLTGLGVTPFVLAWRRREVAHRVRVPARPAPGTAVALPP